MLVIVVMIIIVMVHFGGVILSIDEIMVAYVLYRAYTCNFFSHLAHVHMRPLLYPVSFRISCCVTSSLMVHEKGL